MTAFTGKILISYSFCSEDILSASLYKVLSRQGFSVFNHETAWANLEYVPVSASDLEELRLRYRYSGYKPSRQEKSDPNMFEYLVRVVAEHDVIVVLWSQEYANKFWTRLEWKTALAMCKPMLIIRLDQTPLAYPLERAVMSGNVHAIVFKEGYGASNIADMIEKTICANIYKPGFYLGEEIDKITGQPFVMLRHPFLGNLEIGKYEITNRVFEEFMPEHKRHRNEYSFEDQQPAVYVSWPEANELCKIMAKRSKDFRFRLPDEVEWEFASRAGELTLTGLPGDELARYAVCGRQNATAKVGQKEPNAWGLHDTIGNAAEWCSNHVELYEYNGWINPVYPARINDSLWGAYAVKGGYFSESSLYKLSASYTNAEPAMNSSYAVGLRIVRESVS
jgi:hypothetical protein